MDINNFVYTLKVPNSEAGFEVVMEQGQLIIDDVSYQFEFDDPTYAFAIEVAELRGLFKA